jgi:nitrate reductase NapE component
MATAIAPDRTKLAIVRAVHTFIYVVMAAATLVVFAAGVVGARGPIVWLGLGLVAVEGAIFFGNGMRCPLTTLAKKYGHPSGHVGDTLFPEVCTRYTFRAFGTLYVVGVVLILAKSLVS